MAISSVCFSVLMHFIESINNIPLRVTRTKNSHTTVGVCVFHCNKVANIRATHPVVFYCFKSLFFENNVFHIFYLSFLFNDLRCSCFFVSDPFNKVQGNLFFLYSISIYNSQHNKYCYYSICKKNFSPPCYRKSS